MTPVLMDSKGNKLFNKSLFKVPQNELNMHKRNKFEEKIPDIISKNVLDNLRNRLKNN